MSDAVRIPLAEDRRVFTPVSRSSYRWQDYYDDRGAVEQVNSRLASRFGFERPGIRALAKLHLRVTMAMTMLAVALGRIRAGQAEHRRVWSSPPDRRLSPSRRTADAYRPRGSSGPP